MKKQIAQVKEFRDSFNLGVNHNKVSLDTVNLSLHHKLIQEELDELKEAKDIVEISDAIGDQMYLLIGLSLELGIADKLERVFTEIHLSNMSKLDNNGKPIYREDGKVLKGPNYFSPRLARIINR